MGKREDPSPGPSPKRGGETVFPLVSLGEHEASPLHLRPLHDLRTAFGRRWAGTDY